MEGISILPNHDVTEMTAEPETATWKASEAEYNALVQMAQYEGNLRWTITGAFLLTEALLLGLLGPVAADPPDSGTGGAVLIIGGLAGMIVGLVWALAVRRHTAYYTLRIHQARELEKHLGFRALTDGAELVENGTLSSAPTFPKNRRLGPIDKHFTGRRTILALVITFFALFTSTFLLGAYRVDKSGRSLTDPPATVESEPLPSRPASGDNDANAGGSAHP